MDNSSNFDVTVSQIGEKTAKPRTKPGSGKKKPAGPSEERKQEIRKAVEERVTAEKRAHQTVMTLIEDHVTVSVLEEAAKFIDENFYKDIVTERSIDNLCGYPVCDKRLIEGHSLNSNLYQINTSTNTVYDVTERKCFCSNRCYAASVFYQEQLCTTPVWLRGSEKMEPVRALAPSEVLGRHGTSIDILQSDPGSQIAAEMKAMSLRETKEAPDVTGTSSAISLQRGSNVK